MVAFIKRGHFCIVERDDAENLEKYMHRGYLIISQLPQTQVDFDKLVKLSRYANNIKFLRCAYTEKINQQCKRLENNLFNVQN